MVETALYSLYSAYGYHLNTTLHMTKIFSTENSCILNNAHYSSPIARDSVSMKQTCSTINLLLKWQKPIDIKHIG